MPWYRASPHPFFRITDQIPFLTHPACCQLFFSVATSRPGIRSADVQGFYSVPRQCRLSCQEPAGLFLCLLLLVFLLPKWHHKWLPSSRLADDLSYHSKILRP